jgi:hypothetical protein
MIPGLDFGGVNALETEGVLKTAASVHSKIQTEQILE